MMRRVCWTIPRTTTHQQYGDSPRNNMVTFLDEEFRIVGVRAFDAPGDRHRLVKTGPTPPW